MLPSLGRSSPCTQQRKLSTTPSFRHFRCTSIQSCADSVAVISERASNHLLCSTSGRSNGHLANRRRRVIVGAEKDSRAGSSTDSAPQGVTPKVESSLPDTRPTATTPTTGSTGSNGTEPADVDVYLGNVWEDLKKDLKKNLSADEAKMLETISYDDLISGDNVMRKLANEQLGPILVAMGITADPFDFFMELIQMATFMQLVTVGILFYSAELFAHYDTGEAFRAAFGLTAGYMLRPFFKVEQVLWPVYNWGIRLLVKEATYEVPPATQEEVQSTLNKLGILIAAAFFLPQALLDWSVPECVQFVAPLSVGLFMFDMVYMAALLLKLGML